MRFGAYALPSYHAESDPPQGVFMRRLVDLPQPPMVLAALSQRTQHVRLGTSISVLGLHHPLEVAEQLAMLDLMSHGRVDFGVGRGSEPFHYEAFGLNFEDAQERTLEASASRLQSTNSRSSRDCIARHGLAAESTGSVCCITP